MFDYLDLQNTRETGDNNEWLFKRCD
jgi:hypothetical protein